MPVVGNYVAGVLIALVTTALSASGLTLQKLGHMQRAKRAEAAAAATASAAASTAIVAATAAVPATPPSSAPATSAPPSSAPPSSAPATPAPAPHWCAEPLFAAGVSCMIVSAIVSLAVFALVGQAVASAFSAITIVWALGLSYFVLGERFTPVDAALALVLTLGAVLCVVFGHAGSVNHENLALNPSEVIAFFARTTVYIAAPVFLGVMLAASVALIALRSRRHARRRAADGNDMVVERRVSAGLALLLAGLFSGTTGTCSRAFISLAASVTLGGAASAAALASPVMWCFVVALLVSLVAQIVALNAALKLRPASEVIPVYQSSILMVGAVFGYVFFGEGAGKSTGELAGFVAGVLILLCSFAMLLLKPNPPDPDSEISVALAVPLRSIVSAFLDLHATSSDVIRRTVSAPSRPRVRAAARNDAPLVLMLIEGAAANAAAGDAAAGNANAGGDADEQPPIPLLLPPAYAQTERPKTRRLRASVDAATFVAAAVAAPVGDAAAWRWSSEAPKAGGAVRHATLSPRMLSAAVRASALAGSPPARGSPAARASSMA